MPNAAWTIKAMDVEARQRVTAYAIRNDVTVAQAMVLAIDLLLERERNTRIMLPDDGQTEGADPTELSSKPEANPVSEALHLEPLIPLMPKWIRTALWRRVAARLGIEPPKTRPRKPKQPASVTGPGD